MIYLYNLILIYLYIYTIYYDYPGMLVGMPHSYYSRVVMDELSIDLGVPDSYGTGIIFLPQNNTNSIEAIKDIFQAQAENIGLEILGWRAVKTGT